MSTKALGADMISSLLNEDPFLYAHLVKFEKVSSRADNIIAEKSSDYSYITDASFNVSFDDGSKSVAGAANGAQSYVAGRLTKVGSIADTTEAKVSNVSLTVSSIGLNSSFIGANNNRITITGSGAGERTIRMVDQLDSWVELGFAEGDEIKISSATDADNNGQTVVIKKFITNNYDAVCIHPSKVFTGNTNQTNRTDYTISLDTVEVTSILNDPTGATYNGYINREVSIYKAHIQPDSGKIIGAPYLLFKGIISKAKLTDDPTKNSLVTWTLTSHWGDFIRVNGRVTADSEHRALGANGETDSAALFRDDYANDFGFMHGETAVNIISIYQVMETRYKLKKSGWLFKKYKQVEYQVEVDREVDLRINLEAKRLPVIYGVQRTDSIPIFADSLYNDPAKIYVAYAICEGEVSGIYDIYVDDQSRICVDKNDSDTRSTQTEESTIDVLCEGRMDRGDTLSSATSVRASSSRNMPFNPDSFNAYSGGLYGFAGMWRDGIIYLQNMLASSIQTDSGTGITHERQTTLQYPIASKLVFHAGRSHQRADDTLVNIASRYGIPVTAGSFETGKRYKIVTVGNTNWTTAGGSAGATVGSIFKAANAGNGNGTAKTLDGFKLQTDSEKPEQYWTASHQLLDTAYVVAEYEIAEGDVTIPTLDFVVRGKEIEQYNYDYSFDQHPNPSFTSGTLEDKRSLFSVGDSVKFFSGTATGAGQTPIAQNVQIVDSHVYHNARNEKIHKFRFSSDPIGASDVTKEFFMVAQAAGSNSDSRYPFITWDYKAVVEGTVSANLTSTVSPPGGTGDVAIASTSKAGGTGVDVTFPVGKALTSTYQDLLFTYKEGIMSGFILAGQDPYDLAVANWLKWQSKQEGTNKGATKEEDVANTDVSIQSVIRYALLNAVKLDSAAVGGSGTGTTYDDYYKGQFITIVNTDDEGVQKRQTRKIIGYRGELQIAAVGTLVDVATEASVVSGTHTTTTASNSAQNPRTITLDNVTNLAEGQYLQAIDISSSLGLAYVESGTKIVSPNGINGNTITVDKPVRIQKGALIKFLTQGSATDLTKEQPEEFDFLPKLGDKYSIAALGDKKVSINPAIQLTDYLTNGRYGRGLDLDKDIDLKAFKQAARLCDTRSDITLILNNNRTYTINDTYKLSVPVTLPVATENITISTLTVNQRKEFVSLPSATGRTVVVTINGTDVASSTYTLHPTGITFSTLPTGTDPVVITYSSLSTSIFQWQGVVSKVSAIITGTTPQREVTFTNCIGKVAHKWFDWKSYEPGNIVYHQLGTGTTADPYVNKIYFVTVAGTVAEPAGGNYTSALTVVNQSGTAAQIHVGSTRNESGEGDNPIVKGWNGLGGADTSYEKSGYALYDSDDVKYWRYMGWQSQNQREVTRHQTNALIRTDTPIFDNVNSMLKHFNGILRYTNGKYELDVETSTPDITPTISYTTSGTFEGSQGAGTAKALRDPRIISEGDIIGAITVDDSGLKGSANTVSVSIADPNIRFDNRSVSFFKSDYLKEDRNIPKKKDIKTPLITNYFNARLNAEQYLDQSRFSRKINFVIGPQGVLLLAGTIIKVSYNRFGWVNKEFRISNLTSRPDCSVQVTAEEHSDSTYLITPKNKNYRGSGPDAGPGDNTVKPTSPSNLEATTNVNNMVTLSWTNNAAMGSASSVGGSAPGWTTELWFSSSSTFTTQIANTPFDKGAVRVHTSAGEESWDHNFPGISSNTTRYYWVRHVKTTPTTKSFSAFTPISSASGVQGIAVATPTTDTADIYLYKATNSSLSISNITGDSFPTLTVSIDNSANHGTITGVASGQDSDMTIDGAGQIINGVAAGTGWYTSRQSVSANAKNAYQVYKRISSVADSVDITKSEWTNLALIGTFSDPSDDVGHNASIENLNHTFFMNSAGVTVNDFTSGTTVIHTDGTAFTYAPSGTTTKTYKITLSNFTGGVTGANSPTITGSYPNASATYGQVNISNTGVLSLNSIAAIIATPAIKQASFKCVLSDNANNDRVLGSYVFKFVKVPLSQRVGGRFTYTLGSSPTWDTNNTLLTSAMVTAWAAPGNLSASNAALFVGLVTSDTSIVVDGDNQERRIVGNDKITIKNAEDATVVATRVFKSGAALTYALRTSAGTTSFSVPVVKEFSGSVIVDGTLAAESLSANSTFTNELNVANRFTLAPGSGTSGFINSNNKSSLSSTVAGFFLDSAGNFSLGKGNTNANNNLVYDASAGTLTLNGTFSVAGPPGPSTKTITIYKLSAAITASNSTPNTSATVTFSSGAVEFNSPNTSIGDSASKSNDWCTTAPATTTSLPYLHTKQAFVTSATTQTIVATGTWTNGGIISGPAGPAGIEASFPAILTLHLSDANIAKFVTNSGSYNVITAKGLFSTGIGRAVLSGDSILLRSTTAGNAAKAVTYNGTNFVAIIGLIDGSMMVTDTITADKMAANSITASELQISNNAAGSAGIFMSYNSGNSLIEIRDSNAVRVKLGYIS